MDIQSTVFVVDDDQAVRDGIELLVKSVGLQYKGFASAQEFLDRYEPSGPGCLVLDIRMPGMSGLDLQEKLAELKIDLPVIILTGHGEVPLAVRAMKAGAIDFMEKDPQDQMLLDNIQKAIEKDIETKKKQVEHNSVQQQLSELSPRRREILELIVNGKVNKEIALELDLSEKTIEFHRAKIMKKLGLHSMHELMRFAYKAGLYL